MKSKTLLCIIVTSILIFLSNTVMAGIEAFLAHPYHRLELSGEAWKHFSQESKYNYLYGFFDANQKAYENSKKLRGKTDTDYECGNIWQYNLTYLFSEGEDGHDISWEGVFSRELDIIFSTPENHDLNINDAIYVVYNKLVRKRLHMTDYTVQFLDHLRRHNFKSYIEIKNNSGGVERICFP